MDCTLQPFVHEYDAQFHFVGDVLGPYTIHATPILLLHALYKPTTIIVVPLH